MEDRCLQEPGNNGLKMSLINKKGGNMTKDLIKEAERLARIYAITENNPDDTVTCKIMSRDMFLIAYALRSLQEDLALVSKTSKGRSSAQQMLEEVKTLKNSLAMDIELQKGSKGF